MINISFTTRAWEEYCYWQTQDRKKLDFNIYQGFLGILKLLFV